MTDEPRGEPIQAGEPAPPFELPAVTASGEQETVCMPGAAEAGPVLLIFYQDDGMPICTRELTAIALDHALLEGAGVRVFGINTNGLGSHRKFQERDHFPFPLISDFHGEAVKAYGFWDAEERKSRRALVLVAEGGIVKHVVPHFNPGNVNGKVEIFAALGLA
ncbi:MAG: redoxin domain-containing protein [Dehalococcoidia bacterium]|nr:redoxin domain-containing protein [Dehalococcoidia bacterium]